MRWKQYRYHFTVEKNETQDGYVSIHGTDSKWVGQDLYLVVLFVTAQTS